MYPILFEWGSFVLPAWHTLFALAALTGYAALFKLSRAFSTKLSSDDLHSAFLGGYVGGYLGARLLSIFIEENPGSAFGVLSLLFSLGPMTFYGGAIGGTIGVVVVAKVRRMVLADIWDVAVPACMFAVAVGRIGCFLNGCDFGRPVLGGGPAWWAHTNAVLGDDILRYPTQWISAVSALAIGVACAIYGKRLKAKFGRGAIGHFAMVSYGIYRFGAEFLRGDPRGWVIEGVLSPSQLLSLFAIVIGLVCLRCHLKCGS